MKLSNTQIILVSTLAVFILAFYWVAVRPEMIRKECYQKALEGVRETEDKRSDTAKLKTTNDYLKVINFVNEICLKKRGL